MKCINCGAMNLEEALFCQKCGKRLETVSPDEFTTLSSSSIPPVNVSTSQSSEQQDEIPSGFSVPGQSTIDSTEHTPLPPSPYASPIYTVYGTSEKVYPPPPSGTHHEGIGNLYEKQPPRRTNTHRMYLIVIAILVIMLITAGVLVGILVEKGNTQNTVNNPTASVVPSTPTPSPTPIPSPTPTTMPSPTPSPTPASPQPGTVLYQANWSNGLDGWAGSQDWKSQGGMLVSDGTYQDTNGSQISPTIEPPYQVKETSDYAVEVRIQQLGGQGCFDAVVLRGSVATDGVQGYRFTIGCYGGATIYAAHGSSLNQIAHVDFDPGNTWHTYRLEAKGTSITAFIDGIQVLGVTDATYLSGGVLGMKSEATQIDVSSFKVIVV